MVFVRALIATTLLLPACAPRAATVRFDTEAPCSSTIPCVQSVSGLPVQGFAQLFDLTFVEGPSLPVAFVGGPDFAAADAFVAATSLTAALNAADAGMSAASFEFVASDGTRAPQALIPYISDGADSYLLVTYLASTSPMWTIETRANYGPDVAGMYTHFAAEVSEPNSGPLAAAALGLLALARARFVRRRPE